MNSTVPSQAICEVSEAAIVDRNALFVSISDLPTRIGIVDGKKLEEKLILKGNILPVSAGTWITYSGPEGADVLKLEHRDGKILVSLICVADPETPSPTLVLASGAKNKGIFEEIANLFSEGLRHGQGRFPVEAPSAIIRACELIFSVLATSTKTSHENQVHGQGFTDTSTHYVRSNLRRNIRRPEIAKYCEISESYLTLLIRRNLGISLTDMMMLMRINLAFDYIVGSNLRISVAARVCGFSSNNYFIRAYRSMNGMTPLQVRKLYRRNMTKTIADYYTMFRLNGFKLVEPSSDLAPPDVTPDILVTRYPFAVANLTAKPVALYQRTAQGAVRRETEMWIPPCRNRILWSLPNSIWQAEDVSSTQSLGIFQTDDNYLQTLILS